jgi:hypothetical protein
MSRFSLTAAIPGILGHHLVTAQLPAVAAR